MRSIACERCGAEFKCGAGTNACWCKSLPPAKIVNGAFEDCLCEKCLRDLAAAPPEPKQGEDYYFNESGLMVFTGAYHLKRGYCCKSGCKHCPFDEQIKP